jgi:hypothetical protein
LCVIWDRVLQDMDVWYNASQVYLTDYKPYPNSTYNYIVANETNRDLLGPKSFATILNSTTLTDEEQSEILAGAPFVDGKSTAKIFYTVTNYNESLWMYNYNLFYSWNGCSNQAVALSFNGSTDVQPYIMCPAGVHEADLERMSMLVCKNDQKIKQITYSQHAWSEVRNCQVEGQCLFDNVTGNPISYVALEGHGNYPDNDGKFHVYFYQGGSINGVGLENIGGVYIGDRTGDDPSKTFIPTPDNIVPIPPLWAIQEGYNGLNPEEWQWAVYPGNWGAPLVQPPLSLKCLNRESTEYIQCDKNSTVIKAVYTIANALDLSKIVGDQEQVSSSFAIQSVSNLSTVGYPDITGPMFRAFSYQYISGNSAPILTENVTKLVCPKDVVGVQEIPDVGQLDASTNTIIGYLVGITIGTLLFSIVLIILLALPLILDKTASLQEYVTDMYKGTKSSKKMGVEASQQSKAQSDVEAPSEVSGTSSSPLIITVNHVLSEGQIKRLFIWGTFATLLFIAAVVTLAIGLAAMFNKSILTVAAERLNADSLVSTLYWLTTGSLIFVVVIDAVMFFLIFMFQERTIRIFKFRIWNPLGGRKFFMDKAFTTLTIVVGLIALIIALCAVLFALGLLISIIQLAARVACNAVFNIDILGQSLSSVCIEIAPLKLKICGWEALQACGTVTTMTVRLIMVGAMMLLWCHIVWMVIMLATLETYRSHQIRITKNKKIAAFFQSRELNIDDGSTIDDVSVSTHDDQENNVGAKETSL